MHADNGLLKTDGVLWMIVPAVVISALGVYVAAKLPSVLLGKAFGAFLIVLSVVGLYRNQKKS